MSIHIQLQQVSTLLEKMAMELRFRGCDDQHKLIRESRELALWVESYQKNLRQESNND
jgi:hypothetical protein